MLVRAEIDKNWDSPVSIRITHLPDDGLVEGLDVRRFEVGQTYEVGPHLAELLIQSGCAIVEPRRLQARRRPNPRPECS